MSLESETQKFGILSWYLQLINVKLLPLGDDVFES